MSDKEIGCCTLKVCLMERSDADRAGTDLQGPPLSLLASLSPWNQPKLTVQKQMQNARWHSYKKYGKGKKLLYIN